jgi:hypothetical protein
MSIQGRLVYAIVSLLLFLLLFNVYGDNYSIRNKHVPHNQLGPADKLTPQDFLDVNRMQRERHYQNVLDSKVRRTPIVRRNPNLKNGADLRNSGELRRAWYRTERLNRIKKYGNSRSRVDARIRARTFHRRSATPSGRIQLRREVLQSQVSGLKVLSKHYRKGTPEYEQVQKDLVYAKAAYSQFNQGYPSVTRRVQMVQTQEKRSTSSSHQNRQSRKRSNPERRRKGSISLRLFDEGQKRPGESDYERASRLGYGPQTRSNLDIAPYTPKHRPNQTKAIEHHN